ncbi:hypothetical protein Zm00014a_014240 [Zea mays]|uniref:Uncharacterized protein n=1 Tax=Zea mays TaxID=4577 RepID=A0A3L6EPD8_MAIZE|nr:hypothetical protein Zm00014a_014240 [Zea mays]
MIRSPQAYSRKKKLPRTLKPSWKHQLRAQHPLYLLLKSVPGLLNLFRVIQFHLFICLSTLGFFP